MSSDSLGLPQTVGWSFLADSNSVAVLRVNPAGTVVATNRYASTLTGKSLVGQAWHTMLLNFKGIPLLKDWLAEPARPRLLNIETAAGPTQTLEVVVERIGEDYLLLCEVNGLEQARLGSEVLELNSELNSLTRELALKNSELAQLSVQAQAASHAKSKFLANMSHEVRTPMNGVIGMLDILKETALSAEQQRMLATVQQSSMALLQILNDILDFSKLEAGKLEVEKIPIQLQEVVQGVGELMGPIARVKSIELSTFVDPALPAWTKCDPLRLRQVLLNLVGNAIKFTRITPGKLAHIALRVEPCVLTNDSPGVCLSVRDQGIGMDPEAVTKLFQPFTQADMGTARKFGGTGLGLSISQHLVKLMGGSITASSMLGVGSEFVIELPLQPCVPPSVQPHLPSSPAPRATAPTPEQAVHSKRLILLAEDDEINRDVIQEQLRLLGYACEMAEDGLIALHMWQANPGRYALLLSDCHMPNLDGFGLTRAIREAETAGTHLPIIAVTANAMQGEHQRCREHGMDDYLSKPLRMSELRDKLDKWLPLPIEGDRA